MVNEQEPVAGDPTGQRRRQPNVAGGRKGSRVDVKLSAEETEVLRAKAHALGVSMPRLLVESALAAGETATETTTERRNVIVQLFALQRVLAGIANNVNQMAKRANHDGRIPQTTFDEVIGRAFNLIFDIDAVIKQFPIDAPTPGRRRSRRGAPVVEDDVDDADTSQWEDADH